jgi:hypothetical protein
MYWVVRERDLWGDYGDILIAGLARRLNVRGPLHLELTGPFLPPISFPWAELDGTRVVVSDEFRRHLKKARFRGMRFKRTVMVRIVKLDWHQWDLHAPEPKRYPADNEPENYLLGRKHHPATAEQMPQAWELLLPDVRLKVKHRDVWDGQSGTDHFSAKIPNRTLPTVFKAIPGSCIVVNDAGRDLFARYAEPWTRVIEIERP